MAMLDALELSNYLLHQDFPDTLSAIAHYEQQMRKPAAEAAKVTLEQTESLHSSNAIGGMMEMFG